MRGKLHVYERVGSYHITAHRLPIELLESLILHQVVRVLIY